MLSVHLFHLLVGNDRVVLLQQVFLLKMIVKGAIMSFCVSVLRTVHVTALAFRLDESDFAIAEPTLGLVFLQK